MRVQLKVCFSLFSFLVVLMVLFTQRHRIPVTYQTSEGLLGTPQSSPHNTHPRLSVFDLEIVSRNSPPIQGAPLGEVVQVNDSKLNSSTTSLVSRPSNSVITDINLSHPTSPTHQTQPPNNPTDTESSASSLIKLHWTSMLIGQHVFNFFSAYFDGRTSSGLKRPAVIVMGYVNLKAPPANLYCLFKYSDDSRSCSKHPATERHVSACWQPNHNALPFHFICELEQLQDIPVTVQLSTSADCGQKQITSELPVRNRILHPGNPPKKFGICIGGPLVKESGKNLLKEIIEFVEMSKLMGAEIIVFYANESQAGPEVLQYIWKNYPDFVRTIGWRKFEVWKPFHYYGQMLIISDCFYRLMFEVEYIAMIDLDEMIIPAKHSNWPDLIDSLDTSESIASYYFQNRFFIGNKGSKKEPVLDNCYNTPVPKYFTKTNRIECQPGYDYRPKLISRPKYVFEPSIHWICSKVKDHGGDVMVKPETAILGHYRNVIPTDCAGKPSHVDEGAKRFMDQLTENICQRAKINF